MALANATSKIRLFINEADYSDYLVEGSISDDSAYSTNIITSKGSVKLAGDTSILDYNKTLFPIGSRVTIYSTLDNGNLAKLSRGHLFVLNSSIDVNERSTTLEVGCSLAYLSEREGVFADRIEDLVTRFVSYNVKRSFIVEDYNLSTLQTLLEIDGRVIFQDRWGNIQALNQFGTDGLGSNIAASKLTSFDKETAINVESIGGAIEDIPSAIKVETNVEVPSEKEEEEEDPTPPPFITSETTRLIKRPDVESTSNDFNPENDPNSGDATTEVVAGCGTISDPNSGELSAYAYTIKTEVRATEREVQEKVTNGRYVSYDATGNQVDWEYDFEYCSAMTYAGDLIRGVVDKYVETANGEIEKAKALLSKANQNFVLRDDYGSRSLTRINGVLNDASQQIVNAFEYYNCAAQQYYDSAKEISGWGAKNHARYASEWADQYLGVYGYSNLNQTYNTYGEGGELVEKVQYRYIHKAGTIEAKNALAGVSAFYRLSANLNEIRYKIIEGLDFSPFGDILGESFDQTIEGDDLRTAHDETVFRNPEFYLNLKLVSKTVTTYKYGSIYTTETETFTDYENPSNNYKRVNYSSSGSKNAVEEDRIEVEKDADGCTYVNDSASATENKELDYTQTISIANQLGTPTIPVSWLGTPRATVKTVQLPLDFAPIRTKVCSGVRTVPNLAATLGRYQRILQRYAVNLSKKIVADNFGFRITERGNRAEVFEYYPFYPIALNLTSLQKGYKLRAASSNWVFDSNNVLCSFDCFNVGQIEAIAAAVEVSPYIYSSFIKVEGTATLGSSYFNVPETGTSISISVLPSGGTLAVSGTPVSAGDTISVADITAGNVAFTPSSSGTVEVNTLFEVFDSSGNSISSIENVYPPYQVTYPGTVFADAGEFTLNITNGGYDGDGGDFDLGIRPGGNTHLNAGDFDTGATVVNLEPAAPSGASQTNGDTDPEVDLGVQVLDGDDNTISTDTLPTPTGDVEPQFEVIIEFALTPSVFLNLSAELVPQLGWDYNYIKVPLGTDIDMGTIVDPNTYAMDFGTILSPNTPTLASSVV